MKQPNPPVPVESNWLNWTIVLCMTVAEPSEFSASNELRPLLTKTLKLGCGGPSLNAPKKAPALVPEKV